MSDQPSDATIPGKPAPWNDPKIRAIVFQAILVGVVVMFGFYLINNTLYNMEQRGISTGFSFLEKESGFGVTQSLIEYDENFSLWRHRHILMVERMIGRKRGTGGTDRVRRDP